MFLKQKQQVGFTLIEVLVAVLVLAVGVIGMAGLQFASLRNNTQSLQRTQAAALTTELADQMRANRVAAGTGSYLLTLNTALSSPGTDCAAATCTAAQMAAFDLFQWQTKVLALLPAAKTRVTCPNGTASTCTRGAMQTITIMWDENRTGAAGTSCPSPLLFDLQNDLACYAMSLTP